MLSHGCTVCAHEKRVDIDAALVGGASLRDIAGQHGVSKSAVGRHKESCVPATLVQAREAAEVAHADSLLDQVKDLQASTLAQLERAEAEGDGRLVLAAVREARENIALLGKLLGELDDRPQIVVILASVIEIVKQHVPDFETRRIVAEEL